MSNSKGFVKVVILVLAPFIIAVQDGFSQESVKGLSKETCKCFGKIDLEQDSATVRSEMTNCLSISILTYATEMQKKYKTKVTRLHLDSLGQILMEDLISDCDATFRVFAAINTEADIPNSITDPSICKGYRIGKYRIMNGKDTSLVIEYTETRIIEYDSTGKQTTVSDIIWKNECQYRSTLLETSNDRVKLMMGKKDHILGTLVEANGDLITYRIELKGASMYLKLKRIE